MTDTPTPTVPNNVNAALARVMVEMGGIAKKAGGDLGFPYRGIDAICAAAQPLLGQYGVTTTPYVVERTEKTILKGRNQSEWTSITVTVDWTLRGPSWRAPGTLSETDPGCADEFVSRTEGLGEDNADKGINKAMTGAYKNLLLRELCIGDPQDDTDHESNQKALREAGDRSSAPVDTTHPMARQADELIAAVSPIPKVQEGAKRIMFYAVGNPLAITDPVEAANAYTQAVRITDSIRDAIDGLMEDQAIEKVRQMVYAAKDGHDGTSQPVDAPVDTAPAEPATKDSGRAKVGSKAKAADPVADARARLEELTGATVTDEQVTEVVTLEEGLGKPLDAAELVGLFATPPPIPDA
jgi:hypothetical protein